MKQATRTDGGGDDGNVGYVGVQSGWDSAGRTPGCFAGWNLYGMAAECRRHRQGRPPGGLRCAPLVPPAARPRLHLGRRGAVATGDALPRRPARSGSSRKTPGSIRCWRGKPDGSVAYFPGRQNNGGDSYLNYTRVGIINAAMGSAIRSGHPAGLRRPGPGPDPRLDALAGQLVAGDRGAAGDAQRGPEPRARPRHHRRGRHDPQPGRLHGDLDARQRAGNDEFRLAEFARTPR